ncbi:MAG TPA: protoheme IX farnesyltransferase [Gammaproteobacteria bacterium]|uniref:Protoheme IX farnesyltransferase n=1 Tax=OM182 bacterium TaxID=2510334 RepID=A0A520S1N5_9GAMM|nr:protoheme IX farnesyltransferase [Gammaproteobacteria bacterium]OUX32842.1 MAG: protoheme IX farnesyltransferase [Gammaproteobacteria bacterium TMED260]RPG45697.1 MAG: protoheme IX farnesyltransferase [Gammaproteobacteria bacterium TMED163]RZO76380.1 MAG: protoheme IX farnesyltransferase [OM182 bacterium]HAR90372.1 protoheme IX farnesyltransferase [Gammaproteobacteria bacterium]
MTDITTNSAATWRDYYEMCKPRVVMLMILTSLVGMFLAVPGMVPVDVLVLGNLGIALVAGSGAVVNHLIDRKIDVVMKRTHNRPIPQGRVDPLQAGVFAAVIGLAGMAILLLWVNPLSAWLTLASFIGYAFIYTGYLKHATPQNIVIGGLAGAMPPLLGWSAVTGTIEADAVVLVLIIFAWTPPHFWALAIHRKEEYAKSGVPMLPVTHGERVTKIHITVYTAILVVISVIPYFSGMSSLLYLTAALALGAGFMFWSLKLMRSPVPSTAMDTFKYSIVYLALLFVALVVDHYLF